MVNGKSFNFVGYMGIMIGEYQRELFNKDSTEFGKQLLDTLSEVMQGPCRQNQFRLAEGKLIDNCRDIISAFLTEEECAMAGFSTEEDMQNIEEIKQSTVNVMRSSIEGDPDLELLKIMTNSLGSFAIAFTRMQTLYERFLSEIM